MDPAELSASVAGRIPVRTNRDDRYFTDGHQALPAAGYTAMFERILDHPLIELRLGTSFEEVREEVCFDHLVYTGPIDGFYGHRFGSLPYRSLRFEWERVPTPGGGLAQPVAQVNEPSEEVAHTRTFEYRHLDGRRSESSTLSREYPCSEGHPFYPVPTPASRELYRPTGRWPWPTRTSPSSAGWRATSPEHGPGHRPGPGDVRAHRTAPGRRGPLSRRELAPRRSRRPGRPSCRRRRGSG
ncbi:MAG: UDP-galactopyranose mutase [Solirubrobacterales bacterium]